MADTENIIARIHKAIEEIRPYLAEDGGNIEFVRWEEETGVVEIRFLGQCIDCPMAIMTLRAGIERVLLNRAPEARRIEAVK